MSDPKNKSEWIWRAPDGTPLSCTEKIKVLNENLAEIEQMAKDAIEDAILMGGDEKQIRAVLTDLIKNLPSPHRHRKS